MKPFFCYFGGKYRVANYYPKPIYNTFIEPFAGAAGYSVRNFERKVILYDLDPIICGVWDYLIKSSKEDILKLPDIIDHVDNFNICQEARWLIGFWLNKAVAYPRKSPSAWVKKQVSPNSQWGNSIKQRIAQQVDQIKHWQIYNKSYDEIENNKATWFIDPPYYGKPGKSYKYKINDYEKLGNWCKDREGQVIVCEKAGATWLPFQNFMKIKTVKAYSQEVIWEKL